MNNNKFSKNSISHKELNDLLIKAKKDISSINTFENNQIKENEEFNDLISKDKHLQLPHPRMHLRRFVMQPLCDINKEWVHPLLKEKAKNILKKLANQKIYNIS